MSDGRLSFAHEFVPMHSSNLCILLTVALLVLLCTQFLLEVYLNSERWVLNSSSNHEKDHLHFLQKVTDPVIVWWEPLGGVYNEGWSKLCGKHTCYFTDNRHFRNHPQTKVFMFYGTTINFTQLPLPRGDSVWALIHEESPRNNAPLSHIPVLSLFNYTATFSRYSSYPLTTQYLKNINVLTDLTFFVQTKEKNRLQREEGLAPIMYMQSDCSTPPDRDSYVVELSKYIRVDSYGECLHNKDLPEHLQHTHALDTMMADDTLRLVAKYKFVLALENGVCDDYITEKLWRPLIAGSVPVYVGSPTVSDWLPNNKSAILGLDFTSPKVLAGFLNRLNNNNDEYNSYLDHKLRSSVSNSLLVKTLQERDWGTENFDKKGNYFENFGCFICEKIHSGEVSISTIDHYSCPMPISILSKAPNTSNFWLDSWFYGKCEAEVIRHFVDSQVASFSEEDLRDSLKRLILSGNCYYSNDKVLDLV